MKNKIFCTFFVLLVAACGGGQDQTTTDVGTGTTSQGQSEDDSGTVVVEVDTTGILKSICRKNPMRPFGESCAKLCLTDSTLDFCETHEDGRNVFDRQCSFILSQNDFCDWWKAEKEKVNQ